MEGINFLMNSILITERIIFKEDVMKVTSEPCLYLSVRLTGTLKIKETRSEAATCLVCLRNTQMDRTAGAD